MEVHRRIKPEFAASKEVLTGSTPVIEDDEGCVMEEFEEDQWRRRRRKRHGTTSPTPATDFKFSAPCVFGHSVSLATLCLRAPPPSLKFPLSHQMKSLHITLPQARTPTSSPPPRLPTQPPLFGWGDSIIRSPSVQGFYPPAYAVDWSSFEQGTDPQRLLVARHYHPYHGKNIVVDYLTAYQEAGWVHYTVIYLQGEASPFPPL